MHTHNPHPPPPNLTICRVEFMKMNQSYYYLLNLINYIYTWLWQFETTYVYFMKDMKYIRITVGQITIPVLR